MPPIWAAWVVAAAVGAPCDDARKHYEALSPERALDRAELALAADRTRPLPCLEVRALSLLVLGRREDARAAFAELFDRDPARRVDDPALPPDLLALIEAARAAARPLAVGVRAAWIDEAALRLDFQLSGGLRGARTVRWALEGALARSGAATLTGATASATVAVPPSVDVAVLPVAGSVLDESTRELARFRAAPALGPRPLPPASIAAPEPSGWGWLVWTGVGVAAAAAAAVTIAVVAQPPLPATDGTIGRVDVNP